MQNEHPYPKIWSIQGLQERPDGSILDLRAVSVARWGNALAAVKIDEGPHNIVVFGIPREIMDQIPEHGYMQLPSLLIRVHEEPYSHFGWSNRQYFYYGLKRERCDCGAVHTSWKDDHYQWCQSNKLV